MIKTKKRPLPFWGVLLLLLPMLIDGTTHFFSDLAGIGQGFRDTNGWLTALTNHAFSSAFYAGDAWGDSFNAWMRLINGVLFGLAVIWFGFPLIEESLSNSRLMISDKYQYRALLKKEKDRLANKAFTDIFNQNEAGSDLKLR